ncbi:Glycerol ABC transporter, ATP-binding protein GlpS [hydrothermal vent metagenome]|uniref:Glycerol ABC transporter, ATP-binding protein GlpS n=1 Tax=hydrothermal vent metagenome TaxID=652676 RepID=A0A3B0R5F8_9ZZZZ
MSLQLRGISKVSNGAMHIYPTDIEFQKGTMNVLLGPTSSGKTTLMRLMAGLDKPTAGQVLWQGEDVTKKRVQDRDIAMVYQQFVNYPSMTVYDNIATPLRLQKKNPTEIDTAVRDIAELLKITSLLDRKPHEISGGQQQRCAMARALVKDVGLILMDEPLANLDYKLREELRVEIPRLFEASGSIFVYATTEPEEALLLGGNTATLWNGQVTQFGPAMDVYRHPVDMTTALIYSDPPMNFVTVQKTGSVIQFPNGQSTKTAGGMTASPDGEYRAGFRSHHLKMNKDQSNAIEIEAKLIVTELTGSDTFIHLEAMNERWIGLVPGLRNYEVGQFLKVWLNTENIYYFDKNARRIGPPAPSSGKSGG